ncbi:hypothetical protein TanjilG_13656 [Lupinus angustifolius]|uniref:MBD domain-containing protein n=1 Tax=Lupinus angustifolius TaxID=3871 RepID=A0A1J7HRC3_LUPAN|nr:PREDICTED: methyl-CpG-binding domain-containing protein 9-like isoform X4 [Lupinus angustifolius]OIW03019.1 hypothetical protein TanjilG_13656 [Lupinus angustifolius]
MDFTPNSSSNSGLGIDLNEIPPPDLNVSDLCPTNDFRKQTVPDNSFGANPFGASIAYSNLHNVSAFEDPINHTQSLIKSFEKSLRDFISEWRDELKDGWYVELRQSVSSSEVYAVYCAPDGKTFYSLYEVACYLGKMSGHNSVESEIRNEEPGGPQTSRKRKSPNSPVANGFSEKGGTLINSYCKDPPSDGLSVKSDPVVGNIPKANEAEIIRKEDGHSSPEKSALRAEVPDAKDSSGNLLCGDGSIPDWALELEPVRKLPTNVGTRIRKCIYNALEKNPPEWAKKILLHSISKDVFKGNASGPTKKAVLSVLATLTGEEIQQKPPKKRRK